MPQSTLEREVGSLDYNAGGTSTLELPRSHYFKRLNLLVDWDITVGTGADAFNETGIHELIQNVSVTLNGNQTIKSTSFGLSHYVDHYQYGTQPLADAPDLASATAQSGSIQTFVDFTITPTDNSAMLPAFRTSDLVLEVQWGTESDIVQNADITIDGATVTVLADERLRKSVASTRSQEEQVLNNLLAFKEREKKVTLDAAGETAVELPRGNIYYGVPYLVVDNSAASNSLVSAFKLVEDGVEIHKSASFASAQAVDKQQYNVEATQDGFTYVNYGYRGNLTDTVASAPMDSFQLQVDTDGTSPTGDASVRALTQEIIR